MKIVKVSHNRYIKIKDEISAKLCEDVNNIYDILIKNSDGENSHNHDKVYYRKNEIDENLKNYSLKTHDHNKNYYSKEEVLFIVNNAINENRNDDEICISKEPPQNNEKIWFRITT